MDVKAVCKRLLLVVDLTETTSKELRQMVADELSVPAEQVSQNDIDAAMLEALDLLEDPVDSKAAAPKNKNVKEGKKDGKIKMPTKSAPKQTKQTQKARTSDKKDGTVDRLKSYIAKCGVRKVWKKELDGMSQKEAIAKLEGILRDLGMDGRPTLEKCAQIKKRREFEEEMREIDPRNIIGSRLRSSHDRPAPARSGSSMIISSSDSNGAGNSESERESDASEDELSGEEAISDSDSDE